ncbi:hypothetical protein NKG94_14150 [Micromonospora sp. M12]
MSCARSKAIVLPSGSCSSSALDDRDASKRLRRSASRAAACASVSSRSRSSSSRTALEFVFMAALPYCSST